MAVATGAAIDSGDAEALAALLAAHPGLAAERIGDDRMSRTLLHAAADFPGHRPHAAAIVRLLIDAGAEVDGRFAGPHRETPLHWAASNDDVELVDVLLDAGADIEATGAVIGGGTPLADATAFRQFRAARRLLERGATANLFEAATMGLLDRVEELSRDLAPGDQELTGAFWGACHGGQLAVARHLAGRGADVRWVGWDDLTPLETAARAADDGDSGAAAVVSWLTGYLST
ncbi:MAG TPA: ankyrin repeat domain-containing protein [Acidimicrobiales bacterium]|nr:ankyrin repeat domain-containing protein [Acidimicrobiales bacterium]